MHQYNLSAFSRHHSISSMWCKQHGNEPFCKISEYWDAPFPKAYISQFDEIKATPYRYNKNIRTYGAYEQRDSNIFKKTAETYDAFDVDIAIVDIYFQKSSVIQMGRQSKMNWVDYL